MADANSRPFSMPWTILSVIVFLAVELLIGAWLGPLILGRYVSPMFHAEVQLAMHLLAFYLGGLGVGIVSPGRRLTEPAVGAFSSVLLVSLMSVFMPSWFFVFNLAKLAIGGGIAMFLALAGAWQGEQLMGNLDPDDEAARETGRGRLRASLWAKDDGLLTKRRDRTRD